MSNYYDYREVKVMIAHELMKMEGWKVYGYSPDQSDSMTDYYCPASWGGVAEKNGYILCVDVYGAKEKEEIRKYNHVAFTYDKNIIDKIAKLKAMTVERGASESEAASAKIMIERLQKKAEESKENNNKYSVIGFIPGHMAHPHKCNWHIEKDGIIVAKGNGILKYSHIYYKDNYKAKTENEIREEITRRNQGYSWFNKTELEKTVKYELEEQEEILKLKKAFDNFINKLNTTCGCLVGDGDIQQYEKVTITEYKSELKAVETISGSIKEGQCFILKTSFNYGRRKGLVYRIRETEYNGQKYYHAYKLNGKLTKECHGNADTSNKWLYMDEKFLKWIEKGCISWCELQEVKTPYEVEKIVKKTIRAEKKTKEKSTTKAEKEQQEKAATTTIDYVIEESEHTITKEQLWLVKIKSNLSKSEFEKLKREYATIKGYYSKFTHSFIFKYNPTEKLKSA